MKSISLDDAVNRDIGETGTPEREKFEEELKAEIEKGEAVEIISHESSGLHLHSVSNLLPCPICGGEVIEGNLSWNMAHAECTKCSATWGHCGSKYDGRFDKWNQRAM